MPRQFKPSLIELEQIQIRIRNDRKVLGEKQQFCRGISKLEMSFLCNGIINGGESNYSVQLKAKLNSEYYLTLLDWNRTKRHANKNLSRTIRLASPTVKILDGLKREPANNNQSDDYLIREALKKLT